MPSPFELDFFRQGVVEILLLSIACGVAGTWVVLRGLSFFAHAAGTATFPGLVLADGLGFSAALGASGSALVAALVVAWLARGRGATTDSATAIVLAGALALGAILASDVFSSRADVDRLLFGSLLAIDGSDQALAAVAALLALAASLVFGPRWLATGFSGADGAPATPRWIDAALVLLVALCAVAALSAVGALLAAALIVTPAATTRLLVDRLAAWQLATVALAAAEGVGGLWLAYELDAPPGAGIAVLAAAVFALAALARAVASSAAVTRRRAGRAARAAALTLGVVAALALAGCGDDADRTAAASDPRALDVVASTAVAGDLARQVGGRAAQVRTLAGAGTDPHTYEPRPSDVAALAAADVILLSGRGLDGWARELISASGSHARVVDLGERLPVAGAGGDLDPHWWQDAANVAAATRRAEQALIARRPAARAAIAASATAYRERLAATDRRIAACMRRLPARERQLVTNHDALGLFAARYGLAVVGAVIPSASTAGQASAGELARLERTIERERVRAVFPEESLSPKLARRLAQITGASAELELYGDTLGEAGSGADTVAAMLTTNADRIARGLSGGRVRCEARR